MSDGRYNEDYGDIRYDKEKYSLFYKWGEQKRHKIEASHARGETLDIGWYQCPNKFLKDAIGIDIRFDPKPPQNYRAVYKLEDGKYPFEDDTFDSVISGETIEHVPNLEEYMSEIYRVLKIGGTLIISTPNPTNPTNMIMQLIKWIRQDKTSGSRGDHIHSFMISDMLTLLNIHGFEIQSYRGVYFQIPFTKIQIPAPLPLSFQTVYIANKI